MSVIRKELRALRNVRRNKPGGAVEHEREKSDSGYVLRDAPCQYSSLVAILEEIDTFNAEARELDGSSGVHRLERRGLRVFFCIRVLCTLHRSFYFSLLEEALFKELADHLQVQDIVVYV